MVLCAFCPLDKNELYTCPRCRANYCSIKCYRSKEHSNCSEKFYKDCVKSELKGKIHDGPAADSFEEHMNQYVRGETDQLPGSSGQGENEAEPLDSDDEMEEDDYMKKVVSSTLDEYEQDEDEIERRLIAMGLGGDVEQLMSTLSEEERQAFAQLAEEMHNEEMGLGQSCFKA